MNIIVLHGDNTLKSYERLQKFTEVAKKRGWEIEKLADSSRSLSEILVAESLFGLQKLVVVEGVQLIAKKESGWLKKNAKKLDTNLVIYHRGIIPKTILKSLPKPEKIEEYKLPKLIWQFLDSFYPQNAKKCLILLREVIKNEPIEFVFSLLARQVRDLYWVSLDKKSIPYPAWRVGKLGQQAAKFKNGQLKQIISDFAETDIKVKKSQVNLTDSLDFIIATKLE